MFESGRHGRLFQLTIIRLFQLRGWHIPDLLEQPTVVEPIDSLKGRVLDGVGVSSAIDVSGRLPPLDSVTNE